MATNENGLVVAPKIADLLDAIAKAEDTAGAVLRAATLTKQDLADGLAWLPAHLSAIAKEYLESPDQSRQPLTPSTTQKTDPAEFILEIDKASRTPIPSSAQRQWVRESARLMSGDTAKVMNDPGLLSRFQDGDHQIWTLLYDELQRSAQKQFAGRVGPLWRDLLNEGFLKAYESRHKVKDSKNLAGWVWTITCKRLPEMRRQHKTTSPIPEEPEHGDAVRDYWLDFADGMRHLSPAHRKILELWMRGNTMSEIAATMGLTASAVHARHEEAILEMRRHLRGYMPE